MKVAIFVLVCIVGFMGAYIYGVKWMYQYEISGHARWNGEKFELYNIITKPRVTPQAGVGFYTRTILEMDDEGIWHCWLGDEELLFMRVE